MPEKPADITIAQQVEFGVCRLTSLSALPQIAALLISKLNDFQLTPSNLVEIIEVEPAFISKLLLLAYKEGLNQPDRFYTFSSVIEKLPLRRIRDVLLSVNVYSVSETNVKRLEFRKQLLRHCIAVGCCAKQIAEIALPQISPALAYSAGLLHDLGKLALDEVMPRSFVRINEQASEENTCICDIERKHFGIDHTILGKRLANRWHLPEEIVLAVWLHHSDTVRISRSMPETKIAAIVQLADIIARQCNIGRSGSYNSLDLPLAAVKRLGISDVQLEQIRGNLPDTVAQKTEFIEQLLEDTVEDFSNVVQTSAVRMAQENTHLSEENRRLQIDSNSLKFLTEFLSKVTSKSQTIEVAEVLAALWQKFYQTGLVCIYLIPDKSVQTLEAVIVERQSKITASLLSISDETLLVPETLARSFEIIDASDGFDWLFEQLGVGFELSKTIALPLFSGPNVVAVLVFELRHPTHKSHLQQRFKAVALAAGAILDMVIARHKQQNYAERFVEVVAPLSNYKSVTAENAKKQCENEIVTDQLLEALAEMAAGAAHELNNPLSVISGRAQLLADSEEDAVRKKILIQIQSNANQITHIVDDLISFAQPDKPKPQRENIRYLIQRAVQSAAKKANAKFNDVTVEVDEDIKDVFVDSTQIIAALANIICNSFESYMSRTGPINIVARMAEPNRNNWVDLTVSDLGRGMDAETLRRATAPFFSAKPAGRKRGMGLAVANRLMRLNSSLMVISSRPAEGTTVTIYLPCG